MIDRRKKVAFLKDHVRTEFAGTNKSTYSFIWNWKDCETRYPSNYFKKPSEKEQNDMQNDGQLFWEIQNLTAPLAKGYAKRIIWKPEESHCQPIIQMVYGNIDTPIYDTANGIDHQINFEQMSDEMINMRYKEVKLFDEICKNIQDIIIRYLQIKHPLIETESFLLIRYENRLAAYDKRIKQFAKIYDCETKSEMQTTIATLAIIHKPQNLTLEQTMQVIKTAVENRKEPKSWQTVLHL